MVSLTKLNSRLHRVMKAVGIKRHGHESHPVTLRRLILIACSISIIIVIFSSWLFYSDPRSKYDLVRPGRRKLPETFQANKSNELSGDIEKSDVKIELQNLKGQLDGLDIYGNFKDDALSDYKVLQGYLDQPIVQE